MTMTMTVTIMIMMLIAGPRQAKDWLAANGFAWPCYVSAFELKRCMPDKTLDSIIQDMQVMADLQMRVQNLALQRLILPI